MHDVPSYRRRSWTGLTWSQRRAVIKSARRGEHHPDPVLADAARRWAAGVLAPPGKRTSLGPLMEHLIDFALGGGGLGMTFAERRAALLIQALDA